MKMLTRDIIPCWYELSWQAKPPAIVLCIHKDFIAEMGRVPQISLHTEVLQNQLSLGLFSVDFERGFGFNAMFQRIGERDGFVEFAAELPQVRKVTGKKCWSCKGSKRDPLLRRKCLYCEGTGKEEAFYMSGAYALSASLTVFTQYARFPENETTATKPQLLTVQTITLRDAHGGDISGEYSIPLCEWLKRLGERVAIPEMAGAMLIAHRRMLGRPDIYDASSFWASVERNGWLNISCPGSGCGLSPNESTDYGRGCRFSSHNVDTPMQQLTLLAGLAALHDRARRELAKS